MLSGSRLFSFKGVRMVSPIFPDLFLKINPKTLIMKALTK